MIAESHRFMIAKHIFKILVLLAILNTGCSIVNLSMFTVYTIFQKALCESHFNHPFDKYLLAYSITHLFINILTILIYQSKKKLFIFANCGLHMICLFFSIFLAVYISAHKDEPSLINLQCFKYNWENCRLPNGGTCDGLNYVQSTYKCCGFNGPNDFAQGPHLSSCFSNRFLDLYVTSKSVKHQTGCKA
ncbi:hypothetical protein HZS_7629, partial [Henneguya salminicola]